MNKLLEAVREASISVACLLDEGVSDSLRKDIEHIQDQITIIENFLEPFTVAELEEMANDEQTYSEQMQEELEPINNDWSYDANGTPTK